MTKRIRTTKPLIATREAAERLAGEIAQLIINRTDIQNGIDQDILDIRKQFEEPLTNISKQIEEKTDLFRTWAENNLVEFGDKKSIEFVHAKVGFRTGTPKLKTLMRRTWDTVLNTLRVTRTRYVRTKDEVAKDIILADYAAGHLKPEELRELGVEVVQDEAFYIEPKLETVEA